MNQSLTNVGVTKGKQEGESESELMGTSSMTVKET